MTGNVPYLCDEDLCASLTIAHNRFTADVTELIDDNNIVMMLVKSAKTSLYCTEGNCTPAGRH